MTERFEEDEPTAWWQLSISVAAEHAQRVEAILDELGCQAVTLVDGAAEPLFEPEYGTTPLWQLTTLLGLFAEPEVAKSVLASVELALHQAGIETLQISHDRLVEQDWQRSWMDNFKPLSCGARLTIVPSWLTAPDANAVNLILDPGLAFGTGTHPTTMLCLQWLDQTLSGNENVLDVGCGSGILGLAALALGARALTSIDTDPQALTATQQNARLNDIAETRLQLGQTLPSGSEGFDIVLANILSGTLQELAAELIRCVKPGGHLVLSGILSEQVDSVTAAFTPLVHFLPIAELDGWVRLNGVKT